MRMYRFCFCVLMICLVLALPIRLFADGPAYVHEVVLDEDGFIEPDDIAQAAFRDGEGGCEQLGAFIQNFGYRNYVFRGNMFSIDYAAVVKEFGFELQVPESVEIDFYFYVYVETCDGPPDFERSSHQVDEWVLHVTGTGARRFYSTSQIDPEDPSVPTAGIPLIPGYTYVLGVAWGNPEAKYGRDPAQRPNTRFPNFPTGVFLGSVSQMLISGTEPPLDDPEGTRSFFTAQTGGPWVMEICLAGVCCLPTSACADLSVNECFDAGGEFTAPGLACESLAPPACPLPGGACCLAEPAPGGEGCLDNVNAYYCEFEGGRWHDGEECDQPFDPCEPRGACCLPPGSLYPCEEDVTEATCVTSPAGGGMGGQWRGEGVTCDEFPPCSAGACCDGDFCNFVLTAEDCLEGGGLFAGFGTKCDGDYNPCDATGACCHDPNPEDPYAAADCWDNMSEDECTDAGYAYHGDWTSCSTANCKGRGACCRPGIGCSDAGDLGLTEAQCAQLQGDYQGDGTTCETLDLPCPGVCCEPGGFCSEDIDLAFCTLLGGTFVGYYPDGCNDETLDCSSLPAIEPCCLPDGSCIMTTLGACDQLSGTRAKNDADPPVDATNCQDAVCEQIVTGACCLPGGWCVEVDDAECTNLGGLMLSGFDTCQTGLCAAGACCVGTEDCVLTDAVSCVGLGGDPITGYTPEEACRDSNCPAKGACCKAEGGCQGAVTELHCIDNLGGYYLDNNSDCPAPTDDDACPFAGACCIVDSQDPDYPCKDGLADFACIEQDGIPQDEWSLCTDYDGALCVPGPCCLVDGTCEDDQYLESCAAVNGVFSPGGASDCAEAVCPPVGACCLPTEPISCVTLTETACYAADGSYAGDEVPCGQDADNPCAVGGCCLVPDGGCEEVYRFQCEGDNEFHAGASCASLVDSGVCSPWGACCAYGVCDFRKESLCPEGFFSDVGIECHAWSCDDGACCLLSGECVEDLLGLHCDAAQGRFYPGATCQDVTTCEVRGACCNDGTCSIETETVCVDDLGGEYIGDGIPCDSDLCTLGACCDADNVCTIEREVNCTNQGGAYVGDNVPCEPNPCITGACCIDGACSVLHETTCLDQGGEYIGDDVPCDPDLCTTGACCIGDICSILREATCADQGGEYIGDDVPCTPDPCTTGACCIGETCLIETPMVCAASGGTYMGGTCDPNPCVAITGACCVGETCSIETLTDCIGLGGTYQGDDTLCDPNPCVVTETGACCLAGVCTIESETDCTNAGGSYLGDGTTCDPGICVSIVSSDPPSDAIDARQPSNPDGSNQAGWQSVVVHFDGPTTGMTGSDFTITVTAGTTPIIVGATPVGNDITLDFDTFIPPGAWTVITHNLSGTSTCLGYLPADVNGDRTAAPADVLRVIDCLNEVATCEIWQGDADRDGTPAPADILRVIDLLNGAQEFDPWVNISIPASPCGG